MLEMSQFRLAKCKASKQQSRMSSSVPAPVCSIKSHEMSLSNEVLLSARFYMEYTLGRVGRSGRHTYRCERTPH